MVEGWTDANYRKYRGTLSVDLKVLVNPGVTKQQGQYKLQPVQPDKVDIYFDEFDALKKPRSADKKKKAPAKKVQVPTELLPEDEAPIDDDNKSLNGDAQDVQFTGSKFDASSHPYTQANTCIDLAFNLSEPIIPLPSNRSRVSF
ncbi:hypothetical protein AKO1_003872, partial [Acrasis kona]